MSKVENPYLTSETHWEIAPGIAAKIRESMKNMTTTILEEAAAAVSGPRQASYGPPEENLRAIAELWSTYTGATLTAQDVCMMMVLVKVARAMGEGPSRDSLVDIAGYARCAELCDPKVGPFDAP